MQATAAEAEPHVKSDPAEITAASGSTDVHERDLSSGGLHPATGRRRRLFGERTLEWLGEMLVVFVGVYAAFLLNHWQTERTERAIHLQILQSVEEELIESVVNLRAQAATTRSRVEELTRHLAAGEMPELRLSQFATSYDPADDVALAQAGANHLLGPKTLHALKTATGLERQVLMLLRNRQQLANELIAPHLGEPKDTFYDPETKQLRVRYAWYLTSIEEIARFTGECLAANEDLLTEVRAERNTLQ